MTLDEAIKYCEELAEENLSMVNDGLCCTDDQARVCLECGKEHRQLAEWLRELKVHREIHDVLLQTLVDFDLDICCDDLVNDEDEELICMENCDNQTKSCWVRWAKMKAREKCKDADSN